MKLALPFLISGLIMIGCKDKELSHKHLTTISVVRETEGNPSVGKENTPPQTETAVTAPPAYNQPQTTSRTRYHIIVASFGPSEKSRADRLAKELEVNGYPATVINSAQRYRVSIESFTTEEEANSARDEYRATTDRQDIWVHKIY